MAKGTPPSGKITILEMDGYIHCWHQCGPGSTYASLSKDLSAGEIQSAIDRILRHVRDCSGIHFDLRGDLDG